LFNLADHIDEAGTSLDDLAREAGLNARVLKSVIGVLSAQQIFRVDTDLVFHSESSLLLRSDDPAMIGDIVRWSGSDEVWLSLGQLPHVAKTGNSGFEAAFGSRMFDHLSQHELAREAFRRSMEGYTKKQVSSIMAVVDFSHYGTIVDVGGGGGLLANSIAERYPANKVRLFDLPGVAPEPSDDDIISVVQGDFFRDTIPQADLIILMNVLHDWDDDEAARILANVRRSLEPAGQLHIIEGLMAPEKPSMDLMDVGMAVITGGRQRSAREYEALLVAAGLRLQRQIESSMHLSILVSESA
jgi:hypothetical protein